MKPVANGPRADQKGQPTMIDERYMGRIETMQRLMIGRRKLSNLIAAGRLHPRRAMYDEKVLLFPLSEVEELAKQFGNERGELIPDSGELPPKTESLVA